MTKSLMEIYGEDWVDVDVADFSGDLPRFSTDDVDHQHLRTVAKALFNHIRRVYSIPPYNTIVEPGMYTLYDAYLVLEGDFTTKHIFGIGPIRRHYLQALFKGAIVRKPVTDPDFKLCLRFVGADNEHWKLLKRRALLPPVHVDSD